MYIYIHTHTLYICIYRHTSHICMHMHIYRIIVEPILTCFYIMFVLAIKKCLSVMIQEILLF